MEKARIAVLLPAGDQPQALPTPSGAGNLEREITLVISNKAEACLDPRRECRVKTRW